MDMKVADPLANLSAQLAALPADQVNGVLAQLVQQHWRRVPWSNMEPQIIDTAKADVGIGLAIYHQPTKGPVQVVLMKAAGQDKYQIVGGFMNLAKGGDASPQLAGERETGEELVNLSGKPLLPPMMIRHRLAGKLPLDFNAISVRGQPRVVASYCLRLVEPEMKIITEQIKRLEQEPGAAAAMAKATNNELDGIKIFTLDEVLARSDYILRHADQASLFKRLHDKLKL